MELKTRGKAEYIGLSIVGAVTRNMYSPDRNKILLIDSGEGNEAMIGFLCVLACSKNLVLPKDLPLVNSVAYLHHLKEGDIVVINSDGVINTLYRVDSFQNALLVTERCNSNCLMCSQPPKDREDIPYLHSIHRQLLPLIPKDCQELGITGGEPTLMGDLFFELLKLIQKELPDTDVHCLTNGRSFASRNLTRTLSGLGMDRLVLGIPLYSDHARMHDYIVQASGAFDQTMLGFYNLADSGIRIELRIVLHSLTIPRLGKLARYIYKNLPFVEHVAFMGLEHQGYTPYNIDKLWIDPVDYAPSLEDAVNFLASKRMNVSIYNSQLCLMPENLWKFTRKSISDWKNIYLEECNRCEALERCGGLFSSATKKHSQYIHAL